MFHRIACCACACLGVAGLALGASAETQAPAPAEPEKSEDIDEIVITWSGHARRRFDVIQGTNVLTDDALRKEVAATLGETLDAETGVAQTGFTPGSSRPVIRGLDGARIRVLQNGVGTVDASTTSVDHQVAAEPLLAERIEVLRGAGTLRYGSSAVGGVVNVIDGRVPQGLPVAPLGGALELGYGSNMDARSAAGALRGALALGEGHLVFAGEGSIRRTNDLEVQGNATSARLRALGEPGARGRVPNTDLESEGGSGGVSWVFESGFLGAAYTRLESDYGIPISEEPGGEDIRIDLEQDRIDFGGEWARDLGVFSRALLRGVWADYEHRELEGSEVGTRFLTDGIEVRLELEQKPLGPVDGLVGLQLADRESEAIGEEAFVPPTETLQYALFTVQELHADRFTFEGGLRLERTDHDASGERRDRDFTGLNGSLGVSFAPDESWLAGLSLTRTERAPSVEELYSDGPHLATGGFEVGDPDLDEEVAWSLELTGKKRLGRFGGTLNVFYTRFEDFVFQAETGEIEDDLPVRRYRQRDADFHGVELELGYTAFERAGWVGSLDLGADYVRGQLDGGDDLPRIPPIRVRVGAGVESERADARVELVWVDEQDRRAEFETDTDGYTLLNASLALRPMPARQPGLSFRLQGRNLTDVSGRNHVSFLKERVPIAGRDVQLSLRVDF